MHYTDAMHWNKEKGDKEEQELLKEHGDDWALHLEGEDAQKTSHFPLHGIPEEVQNKIDAERKKKAMAKSPSAAPS